MNMESEKYDIDLSKNKTQYVPLFPKNFLTFPRDQENHPGMTREKV
jgi:hypothetical protein